MADTKLHKAHHNAGVQVDGTFHVFRDSLQRASVHAFVTHLPHTGCSSRKVRILS